MQTRASIARHPIHTMLVPIPLGLFVGALVFDLLYVSHRNPSWAITAFWDIGLGIVGACLAALPGVVDYLTLGGANRRLATWHLVFNLSAVVVFLLNFLARTVSGRAVIGPSMAIPLVLTVLGMALLLVGGWLGGELVYRRRVGVEEDRQALRQRLRRVA
jgi:uncharacterized membrane protein